MRPPVEREGGGFGALRCVGAALLFLVALTPCVAQVTEQSEKPTFRERFESLIASSDAEKVGDLIVAERGEVVGLIEDYLDEAHAILQAETGDKTEAFDIQGRTVKLAIYADELLGTVLFSDYATAVIGWTADDRESAKHARATLEIAHRKLGEGKADAAFAAAQKAAETAQPLGDWPVATRALALAGQCAEKLERPEVALSSFSSAFVLGKSLGLHRPLFTSACGMARILENKKQLPRALNAAEGALRSAYRVRNVRDICGALELYARLQGAAGDELEAKKTRQELELWKKKLAAESKG